MMFPLYYINVNSLKQSISRHVTLLWTNYSNSELFLLNRCSKYQFYSNFLLVRRNHVNQWFMMVCHDVSSHQSRKGAGIYIYFLSPCKLSIRQVVWIFNCLKSNNACQDNNNYSFICIFYLFLRQAILFFICLNPV